MGTIHTQAFADAQAAVEQCNQAEDSAALAFQLREALRLLLEWARFTEDDRFRKLNRLDAPRTSFPSSSDLGKRDAKK